MDPSRFTRVDATTWRVEPHGAMRVPAIIYADEALIRDMDDKVYDQAVNVATLPGIVQASYAMPDAHWGYGFPIGGVAAFDPDQGGVVSAGGVGFDISCGVRTMLTGLSVADIAPVQRDLAESLYRQIPAGLGSRGRSRSTPSTCMRCWRAAPAGRSSADGVTRATLSGSKSKASWQARSRKTFPSARRNASAARWERSAPATTIWRCKRSLRSTIRAVAETFELAEDEVVVTIHCGSRGLGHQIGTEFLKEMVVAAGELGIALPDRELACAPINSDVGQRYLSAMRAAINCALANREILGHYARRVFAHFFPERDLRLLFDVSHNTCKVETHVAEKKRRELFVHRKGATRAFGPGHPSLPDALRAVGQPVIIGGSMGTGSYILVGAASAEERAFASACHGAGRALSRHAALKRWSGRRIIDELAAQGILIRSPSTRGVAEEAPGAYKDVGAVVAAAEQAGLARRVARLRPLICIKG